MNSINLLITGVGGQGVILASDIISEVAVAAGYDVKKTDTLGMAQRGGSVVSHLRMASEVWSPLIKEGEVDILLSLEKLESARWAYYLRPDGIAIVNNHSLPPLSVSLGNEQYPDDKEINGILRQWSSRVYIIDGTRQVKELGNVRTLNIFMIGCLSVFLPVEARVWEDCIIQRLPQAIQQVNINAFTSGRKEIERVSLPQG